MAYGLEIFDASGRRVLDVVDRLGRLVGSYTASASVFGVMSGFIAVSGMARDGTWLVTPTGYGITGSYSLGNVTCVCAAGGFNWYHNGDTDGITIYFSVFKL